MIDPPVYRNATFGQWHQALCAVARENGGSAAQEQGWMHRMYGQHYTPAEAWDAFTNDEVPA